MGFIPCRKKTEMKPILFSTAMVQAILAGRKTQTRRATGLVQVNAAPNDWQLCWTQSTRINGKSVQFGAGFQSKINPKNVVFEKCPYGKPGDVLWVRETWANLNADFPSITPYYVYKADLDHKDQHGPITWKPSIHMPKTACRLFLKITNIRAERLQDISERNAIAEGILAVESFDSGCGISKKQLYQNYLESGYTELLPKDSFKSLWQSINGKESWYANPWIWVVEFEQTEKPTNI
jgi:hypothetical protein